MYIVQDTQSITQEDTIQPEEDDDEGHDESLAENKVPDGDMEDDVNDNIENRSVIEDDEKIVVEALNQIS